jgi:beta-lactamase regulating signal transducer with metallopeptidase domain/protein involved in polysaccharide export with SLBB domain
VRHRCRFVAVDESAIAAPTAASVPAPAPALPLSSALGLVWLAGAAAILMTMGIAVVRIKRLSLDVQPVEDTRMADRLESARKHFGVRRPVALLMSSREWMPITWGVLRPAILLPASAASWPQARLDAVLAHEMAHIARGDTVAQRIARTAVALFWFNPLVWVAARRARFERERACDDAVLAWGLRATDYANDLMELAQTLRAPSRAAASALAVARRSQLEARIGALLDGRISRRGTSGLGRVIAAALVLVMLPMAAAQLAARPLPIVPPPVGPLTFDEPITLPAQVRLQPLDRSRRTLTASPLAAISNATQVEVPSPVGELPQQNSQPPAPRANWRVEREAMLKQLVELARALVKDTKTKVEIGTAAQIDAKPLEEALAAIERAMPAPASGCTAPDPYVSLGGGTCLNGSWIPETNNPTDQEIAAARARFATAMRNLDEARVRWDNGLVTTGELDRALRAALKILTEDIKRPDSAFTASNFPGSTEAERASAQKLYELLTGRASSITVQTPPPPGYVVGINDVITIVVLRETDASGDVVVRPDGKITLRTGNDIVAAGLTIDELKARVTEEIKKAYKEPTVFVQVKSINSRNIPIRYVLRSGSNTLSDAQLLDALKSIGGVKSDTERANLLLDLADRYAFTPEMVSLYVSAAKGIASTVEQARVFAKPIRVK